MGAITDEITLRLGLSVDAQMRFAFTLILLPLLWIIRALVAHRVQQRIKDPDQVAALQSVGTYVAGFASLVVLFDPTIGSMGLMFSYFGISGETQEKILYTVISLAIIGTARAATLEIVRRRDSDMQRLYRWRRISAYAAFAIAVLVVMRIWLSFFGGIGTFLGLVSAGVAIALKDPILNLVGWLFIVTRRPFEAGHRIELGSFRGDVVDIRLFDFAVMEIGGWVSGDDRTGRLLLIPNGKLFTEVLVNYHGGWFEYIWDEIKVVVTFESNWEAARELMTEIVQRHGERLDKEQEREMRKRAAYLLVLEEANFQPHVYVSVDPYGVDLTMRYLVHPRRRRRALDRMWVDILHEFGRREDIDFAYPTQRFYDNVHEGKLGARASAPVQYPMAPAGWAPQPAGPAVLPPWAGATPPPLQTQGQPSTVTAKARDDRARTLSYGVDGKRSAQPSANSDTAAPSATSGAADNDTREP